MLDMEQSRRDVAAHIGQHHLTCEVSRLLVVLMGQLLEDHQYIRMNLSYLK